MNDKTVVRSTGKKECHKLMLHFIAQTGCLWINPIEFVAIFLIISFMSNATAYFIL